MKTDIVELRKRLGRRLLELRKRARKSQLDFSLEVGIDRTFYGPVERGERNISLEKLVDISDAYGLTLSELLSGLQD